MMIKTRRDEVEIEEIAKLIKNKKVSDISKYNKKTVEEILEIIENGRSLKITKRWLSIGRHQLFPQKEASGNVTTNTYKVVTVAGKFCADVYSDINEQEDKGKERDSEPGSPYCYYV